MVDQVVIDALTAPSVNVTRRVDIYEQDGTTPYLLNAPFTTGSVSVDQTRAERRQFDMVLDQDAEKTGKLIHYPGGFWYDKVLKVYRGLTYNAQIPNEVEQGYIIAEYFTDESSNPNKYAYYRKAVGLALAAGDTFEYELQWPGGDFARIAMDLYFSDGVSLRDSGITDQNGLSAHADTDIPSAYKAWTRRVFDLTSKAGKTLVNILIAGEKNGVNTDTTGWIRNVYVRDSTGAIKYTFQHSVDPTNQSDTSTGMVLNNVSAADFVRIVNHPALVRSYTSQTVAWETQVGEFVMDKVSQANFPSTLSVSGRDYTKRLLTSKFPRETAFAAGVSIESVIRTIALNGGISKFILPTTGESLSSDKYFDRGTTRMDAITQIANSYGYDAYFTAEGYLTIEAYQDPVLSPVQFTFETGVAGTISKFNKSTTDTRIYNHVVVIGGDANVAPIIAEAVNTEPDSPTNVDELGDRVYEYASSFISTLDQAQDVADKFLKIYALEQYDLSLTTLVLPFLEVGRIIRFVDPHIAPGDPDRFLLSSMSIPLDLGPMDIVGKRVTVVS